MYIVLMSDLSQDMEKFLRVFVETDVGIPWRDVRLVTALGQEQPAGANRKYTAEQVRRAGVALKQKLSAIPRTAIVVPMGPDTTRLVTGRQGKGNTLEDLRGYILPHWQLRSRPGRIRQQIGEYKTSNKVRGYKVGDPKFGMVSIPVPPPMGEDFRGHVIPTYDPTYIQETGRKSIFAWIQDLGRVAEGRVGYDLSPVVGGKDGFPRFNEEGMLERLLTGEGPVAFDIETVGYTDVIERIAFSDGTHTVSLPWTRQNRDHAIQILGDKGRIKVAHNIMFDVARLEKDGVKVAFPWWDTMLAHTLFQPELPKGLGRVSSLYLRLSVPWKAEAERFPEAYNAKDAWATALVQKEEAGYLEETGMTQLFMQDIMRSIPVLMDMSARGIKVDTEFKATWTAEISKRLEVASQKVAALYPGVSASAPRQVAWLLYEKLGLPVHRNRDDGVTTDSAALHDLMRTNPEHRELLELLLEVRDAQKTLRTYAEVEADPEGRIHPEYLPQQKDERRPEESKRKGAASTGRLGCANPPIQQQPLPARRLYVPDYPDYSFVGADWNQAELRILGALSQDQALIKALDSEGGVHVHTMKMMGVDKTTAKITTFLTTYGGGPKKLQQSLLEAGVEKSEADCKAFQKLWAMTYPMAWDFLQRMGEQGKRTGYLVDPFGRRRQFYGGGRDIPEMKDFMPQATVAGMMWRSFVPLYRGFIALGGRLVTQVHDEFLGQVPDWNVDYAAELMEQVLGKEFPEIAPGFRVPITVKVGKNWRDMEAYVPANRA